MERERNLAIKILSALNIELSGENYYKVEDLITDIIKGEKVEPINLPYLEMYYRETVVSYLIMKEVYDKFNPEDIDDIVYDLMEENNIIDDYAIAEIIDNSIEAVEEE